jgi:hypothetical protein
LIPGFSLPQVSGVDSIGKWEKGPCLQIIEEGQENDLGSKGQPKPFTLLLIEGYR